MPRGREYAVYATDAGTEFAVNEDSDYVAQLARGWTPMPSGASRDLLPRGFKPRRVYGIDAEGYRGSAVVASNAAPLWIGTVNTFDIEGSDGATHTMVVTGRVGEKRRIGHAEPDVLP